MAYKYNIQKARAAGLTEEQIQQQINAGPPQIKADMPQPEQKQGFSLTDLLPLVGSIGGGLLGVPLGLPGIIGGSAIGGGLGKAGEQLFEDRPLDLGEIGGEAALSGAFGLVGGGAGKLLGSGLKGVGKELTKGTLRSGIKAGAGTSEKIASEQALKSSLGLKGSPAAIAEKTSNLTSTNREAIKELLKTAPNVEKSTLEQIIKTELASTPYAKSKVFLKEGDDFLSSLKSQVKTNEDLLAFRDKMYPLIATGSTSEQKLAAKAVYDGINAALKGTSPEVAALIDLQPQLYGLGETYSKVAAKGTNLPFLGSSQLASRPVGAARDLTSRLTEKTGGTLGNPLLTLPTAQTVGQGLFGGDQTPVDMPVDMPESEDIPVLPEGNKSEEIFNTLALLDLMQGGKNVNKIIAVSKLLNPPLSETQKTQVQQLQGADSLVDQLETVYTQGAQSGEIGPYGKGTVSSTIGRITGGQAGGNALLFNNLRQGFTALIARSTGERGVLTDNDAKRALSLLPTVNSDPKFAARQFAEIRKIFQNTSQRLQLRKPSAGSGIEDILPLLGGGTEALGL